MVHPDYSLSHVEWFCRRVTELVKYLKYWADEQAMDDMTQGDMSCRRISDGADENELGIVPASAGNSLQCPLWYHGICIASMRCHHHVIKHPLLATSRCTVMFIPLTVFAFTILDIGHSATFLYSRNPAHPPA
jgi:hypothetical protein